MADLPAAERPGTVRSETFVYALTNTRELSLIDYKGGTNAYYLYRRLVWRLVILLNVPVKMPHIILL